MNSQVILYCIVYYLIPLSNKCILATGCKQILFGWFNTSTKSCKRTVNEAEAVAWLLHLYLQSTVTWIQVKFSGSKNMRITHKTEVRYAGGDADTMCPACCWTPAWKVMELACDTEVMRSEWTFCHSGGKAVLSFCWAPCPRMPLLSRESKLIGSWVEAGRSH